MSKHTKGEWKANGFSVTKSNGFKIRQERPAGAVDWEAVDEKYIADAKLIAAAPDLLEALQTILEFDEITNVITMGGGTPHLEKAFAAIKKATI